MLTEVYVRSYSCLKSVGKQFCKMFLHIFASVFGLNYLFKNICIGRSQDGGGIGLGDHFLSYKFIKRITEQRANFTKQLLITSWGHQAPRKASHCLRKKVGQNIKDKKRDKRAKDGEPSREGSLNRGSFQTPGNSRTGGSGGSFWISEGNLTGRGTINKTHRLRA